MLLEWLKSVNSKSDQNHGVLVEVLEKLDKAWKSASAPWKSWMQKLVRRRAKEVDLSPVVCDIMSNALAVSLPPAIPHSVQSIIAGYATSIEADVALAAVMIFLLTHPGSFVPDIQRFVTGTEAMPKRLVVTTFEDSCVEEKHVGAAFSALCAAMLAQRVPSWKPSLQQAIVWIKLGIAAWKTSRCFAYDIEAGAKMQPFVLHGLPPENESRLKAMSAMLDELGSFGGDKALLRYVASKGLEDEKIYFSTKAGAPQPTWNLDMLPLTDLVDQHAFPDFARCLSAKWLVEQKLLQVGRTPFAPLFGKTFRELTGTNPRRQNLAGQDGKPFTKAIRAAQTRYLEICLETQQQQLSSMDTKQDGKKAAMMDVGGGGLNVSYTLHPSWLAGLVGVLEVRSPRNVWVCIKPDSLQDLVAFRRPSRGMKSAKLTQVEQQQAVAAAQRMLVEGVGWPGCDPPLPAWKGATVRWDEEDIIYHYSPCT